jgi:hypothetical protein
VRVKLGAVWRVVFKSKDRDYQLIVSLSYKLQIAYVRFIGTHKEYMPSTLKPLNKTTKGYLAKSKNDHFARD